MEGILAILGKWTVKLLFGSYVILNVLNTKAQNSVVFYDTLFNEPISNVQVFNANSEFIGLSNELGVLVLQDNNFPFEAKCGGYQIRQLNAMEDTIVLDPKFQKLDEVKVSPVNKMKLYNEIIRNSSDNVHRSSGVSYGVYFESLLIVDSQNNDSIRVDKICDLALERSFNKKKFDYNFYCENGRKSYVFSGSSNGVLSKESSDTSVVVKMLRMIPEFEKNLEYDLIKTKKYNLKYDENEITREVGEDVSRIRFENTDEFKSIVSIKYHDSILYFWRDNRNRTHRKEYDGNGIFFNINKTERQVEFGETNGYFLNTIIVNTQLDLGVDGVLYEIYLVKGFIYDDSISFELSNKIEKVEGYFNNLNTENELNSFYNFELEK
ncbi:MAG: hypothetical protein JKY09_05575 [Crocinitomicaceae bacterium]|nr:hypothetical protein [Crocinitomicaceae bacterium]